MATTIRQTVSDERLAEILCSTYEGGSNYWARQDDGKPSPYRISETLKTDGGISGALEFIPGFDVEITDIEDDDEKKYRLTLPILRKGLQIMAEKYPRNFSDILTENDDAITGDVLLQCALFGELVYG